MNIGKLEELRAQLVAETKRKMAKSVLKILDDVVADIYPPEEREEAKARILDA